MAVAAAAASRGRVRNDYGTKIIMYSAGGVLDIVSLPMGIASGFGLQYRVAQF